MRSWNAERMDRSQSIASAAGLDRRSLLRLAAGSLGGACAGWSSILNASPTGRSNSGHSKARSVIMIFNCGAPSHHDLWDPKPQAPDDVRGIFSTIDTNVQARPDSRYGLSKHFGEGVGALYAYKHGLGVTSLRIGNVNEEPIDRRLLLSRKASDF